MIIINNKLQANNSLSDLRKQQKTIGLIPTMGALHKGHISLLDKAKEECTILIASIFVNPTQFNNKKDLDNYPQSFEKDCKMLEEAGCDFLFAPEISDIYNEEELKLKNQNLEDKTWTEGKQVDFGSLEKVMEGIHRPGHFNGVAQVVSKLFKIIKPDKAYFGQKDFQQLAIIKKMVAQMEIPVKIVSCPTLREANGLAMSSRNELLSKKEREVASLISKTLFKVKEDKNSKSIMALKTFAENEFKSQPLFELEYFEIADSTTLQPIYSFENDRNSIAFIAAKIGSVRLIDNMIL